MARHPDSWVEEAERRPGMHPHSGRLAGSVRCRDIALDLLCEVFSHATGDRAKVDQYSSVLSPQGGLVCSGCQRRVRMVRRGLRSHRGGSHVFCYLLCQIHFGARGCEFAHGVIVWRAVQPYEELRVHVLLGNEAIRCP